MDAVSDRHSSTRCSVWRANEHVVTKRVQVGNFASVDSAGDAYLRGLEAADELGTFFFAGLAVLVHARKPRP